MGGNQRRSAAFVKASSYAKASAGQDGAAGTGVTKLELGKRMTRGTRRFQRSGAGSVGRSAVAGGI